MKLKIRSFGHEALSKFKCDVLSRDMNKFRMPALAMVIYVLFLLFFSAGIHASTSNTASGDKENSDVMSGFIQDDRSAKSEIVLIPDQRKRLIMFIMGIPLLIFIATTVALGVAMVVYGKKVFIPHMIFAGLSLTLALGHAVVGLVWFNPF